MVILTHSILRVLQITQLKYIFLSIYTVEFIMKVIAQVNYFYPIRGTYLQEECLFQGFVEYPRFHNTINPINLPRL